MEKYYSKIGAHKQINRLKRLFRSRFYLHMDKDIRHSILIAGTGRSGTTWLAEIINSMIPCRLMFEPFFFEKALPGNKYHLFQYLRSEQDDDELYKFACRIFSGQIRDRRIDLHNRRLITKYRVIKEIRANLFLKWLNDRFPEVPLLYIIRHPCAVVLSRKELGWATDADIEPFLRQESLITDFLSDKLDLIQSAKTEIEKHALIWSISNLVPLKQFKPGQITIIYYEDLCTHPEIALSSVFKAIGVKRFSIKQQYLQKPSVTTIESSAVVTGEDRISRWKNHLTPTEIDQVLNIVDEFGLGSLYRDSLTPAKSTDREQELSNEAIF